jgi:deoxyribodipyrimidine photo-lyase
MPPLGDPGPHRRRFEEEAREEFCQRLYELGVVVLTHPPDGSRYSSVFLDEGGCLHNRKEALEVQLMASRLELPFHRSSANLLFSTLPVSDRKSLRTFTDFRKAVSQSPVPPEDSPVSNARLLNQPRRVTDADPRSVFPYRGAESDALAHLRHYLSSPERVHSYKATRNRLLGIDDSSKLSPFLATGALSVRAVWSELLRFEQEHGVSDGTEWLKFELLWREYFRWLELDSGETFYSPGGSRGVLPPPSTEDRELFLKWTRGETGIPFIDANLRELNLTGFMSNRGRQNVASHFIHELCLPWWWGADYFSKMLVDSDPAQNYGNWSYLAGVGADPRSFGGQARKFDLVRQVREYDPDGEYQRTWL